MHLTGFARALAGCSITLFASWACTGADDSDATPEDGGEASGGSEMTESPSSNPDSSGDAQPGFQCMDTTEGPGDMVPVEEGEFLMGCNEQVDSECDDIEKPGRMVFISAFEIDRTQVTQAQYAECVVAGDCAPPSCDWDCDQSDRPAGCVTREQAMDYCSFAAKRLPTEAEWEKAARGTDGRKYPWGNEEPTCELSVLAGCTDGAAAPVGSVPDGASPYGALDMAGNVVEMVADWYDPQYYANAPDTDPQGPPEGPQSKYVGRGGGYKSEAYYHRASVRDWYVPTDAGESLGFRCAR